MRSHKAKKSCDKAGNDKEYADYPLISPFWVIGQNVLVKIYIMLVLRAEYGAY